MFSLFKCLYKCITIISNHQILIVKKPLMQKHLFPTALIQCHFCLAQPIKIGAVRMSEGEFREIKNPRRNGGRVLSISYENLILF